MSKTGLLLLALAAVACKSESATKQPSIALTDLTTSVDAIRAEFNAHKTEARFVTLLSAT